MYAYDEHDRTLVTQRAEQFRGQVERRIEGDIREQDFKSLRVQNGLYLQLHSYMLRVAIPYGLLSSRQLRMLAHVARVYDRGYGHFTTRQNIQFNWPSLEQVPDILAELATVEMHAIQTSGNCIRNVTSDPLAGVAPDELEDPRPYCELLRQWSTFHPEFAYLPRKFKIAVTGAEEDRAAIRTHDIGLRLVRGASGEVGFEVWVGGGLGRTPLLARRIRDFLPKGELLTYCESILRVYNRFGRRDNKFKARIKIMVKALGPERFAELVEREHGEVAASGLRLRPEDLERMRAFFSPPAYDPAARLDTSTQAALLGRDRDFARWVERNVLPHRQPGYAIVALSLKSEERPPGDVTADQMDAVAFLADRFSFGRIRVTHRQNLVFSDVRTRDLRELWTRLRELDLATPNHGTVTDIVACPGLDYCSLASARSLAVVDDVKRRFADVDRALFLGEVTLNVSGCVNACAHHHVGHIGVLGIDKQGVEHYQLMLGGASTNDASVGEVLGRALRREEVGEAVERVLETYAALRSSPEERFIDTYRRVGSAPFQEAVYAHHQAA